MGITKPLFDWFLFVFWAVALGCCLAIWGAFFTLISYM